MPVRRSPATKVVVFQWPCGTPARSRSPRGARPWRRAMLVEAQVSSMKTRRSGSRSSWLVEPRPRAASGCRAGPARSHAPTFFARDPAPVEEAPQRADRRPSAPCSASSACSSARVMSGVAAIRPRIRSACASILPERRSPPCGFGFGVPCCATSCCQRIALDALTPNRAAACLRDRPPATAATTLSRRSTDNARRHPCQPPPPAGIRESENRSRGNP